MRVLYIYIFTHCSLKAANGHPFPMAAPIEVDICTRVVRSIHLRPMPEEKGTEISKGPPSLWWWGGGGQMKNLEMVCCSIHHPSANLNSLPADISS